MQKQRKQFIAIIIILLICAALLITLKIYNDKKADADAAKEEAETIHITDMDVDAINAFSYIYNNETLEFVKEDETWYYSADKTLNIDQDAVNTMLTTASSLTAESEVSDYEDLSEYGMDTPSNTITLTTADGTITLNIGSENSILSQYYVMLNDSDNLYLVANTIGTTFQKALTDLIVVEDTTETENLQEATE